MLDDLRNSASNPVESDPEPSPFRDLPPRRKRDSFLGMNPVQRFVLVLLLFLMTCVLGAGCLVLTGKVFLPFF
jgi:hypothetical protein